MINTKKVIIFGQVLKRMSNVDESQIRRARMINTSYAKIFLQVMVDRVKLSLRVYHYISVIRELRAYARFKNTLEYKLLIHYLITDIILFKIYIQSY